MTPNSASYDVWDFSDSALVVGRTFEDAEAGITITPVTIGATATLNVTVVPSANCSRNDPTASIAGGAASVAAGTAVNYSVAVVNNDGNGCAPSIFTLNAVLPAGWTGTFGATSSTLSPGGSVTVPLTVTSAPDTPVGTYVVNVTATSGSYYGSSNGTYVVGGAFTTTVATSKSVYTRGNSVVASATVISGGRPIANAGVTFAFGRPDGTMVSQSAKTNSNGVATAKYRVSQKDPLGMWFVRESAAYKGLSASASTNFSVQ